MPSRLVGQPIPFGPRDAVESHRASQQIARTPVLAEDFGQAAGPFAAQPIQLEQPILRHHVTEADKEILIRFGIDVRDAKLIPLDFDGARDGRLRGAPRSAARRVGGRFLPELCGNSSRLDSGGPLRQTASIGSP